jgi:hypothetical protein
MNALSDPRPVGTIWMLDMDGPLAEVTPLLPVQFSRAGQESIPALAAAMGGSPREIEKRLESGKRCYTAWVGDGLAAYGWISFQEEAIGELNLRVRLLPGEAYIWDCATLPPYRQNGLYSALLAGMLAGLQADQFCRTWIGANLENVASQRGMRRAGFHHVADLVLAKVFARRLVWVLGRPGVTENLVMEARRVFLDSRDQVWLRELSSVQ